MIGVIWVTRDDGLLGFLGMMEYVYDDTALVRVHDLRRE